MSTTEWLLLVVVLVVPLLIAVMVTLWTLEQARLRSRKARGGGAKATQVAAEPAESAERSDGDDTGMAGGSRPEE